MRIVFMGTPEFAVPVLDALLLAPEHEVVAVYSQPPRPGGRRGRELTPSPVQARAEGLGIPVRHPVSLKGLEAQCEFAAFAADVAVVAAYGLILPQAILDAPRLGCINVHASLLPRWRGAAPIQRAILAGDAETGVDIMQMEAGLDTGPILSEARIEIENATAGELTDTLARLGARLLISFLQVAGHSAVRVSGQAQPVHRVEPTYAKKIDKAELRIDFTQPAEQVERQIRAFNPPGAYFEFAGERIRILAARVQTGEDRDAASDGSKRGRVVRRGGLVVNDALEIECRTGEIIPVLVQRSGRGVMTSQDFLRGFPIPPGTQL